MTTPILQHLIREHRHIESLLRILDRQLAGIGYGDRPDYRLTQEIVHYLTRYPDLYHHPYEDRIFALLIRRRPDLAREIDRACATHRVLATTGSEYLELINLIISGVLIRRSTLVEAGRAYVDTYMTHIRSEEDNLLSQCEASLEPADWMILVTACHWQAHPLFPDHADQAYQHLRECITLEGAGPWPWINIDDRSCPVCSAA